MRGLKKGKLVKQRRQRFNFAAGVGKEVGIPTAKGGQQRRAQRKKRKGPRNKEGDRP